MDKLPSDFDGVFRFTNFTDEDFVTRWDSVEYTFPAQKTSPIIIPTASPEQVQNIRKKFAKELAEREFYRSKEMRQLDKQNTTGSLSSFRNAVTYAPSDLEASIQRCLEPLPLATVRSKRVPKEEVSLRTDNKGKPVTKIVEDGESLVGEGQVVG